MVFEGLNPEGVLLAKALDENSYAGLFVGPDALLRVREFIVAGAAATDGAIISGGPMPDEAFVAKFRNRFQREPSTSFVLEAYDATTANATAESKAGQTIASRLIPFPDGTVLRASVAGDLEILSPDLQSSRSVSNVSSVATIKVATVLSDARVLGASGARLVVVDLEAHEVSHRQTSSLGRWRGW